MMRQVVEIVIVSDISRSFARASGFQPFPLLRLRFRFPAHSFARTSGFQPTVAFVPLNQTAPDKVVLAPMVELTTGAARRSHAAHPQVRFDTL